MSQTLALWASAATDTETQGFIGIIGVLAVALAGAMTFSIKGWQEAKRGAMEAKAANSAVNNIGPGEHRLYDKVANIDHALAILNTRQEDFDEKGWEHGLPDDLNSAPKLTQTVRELQAQAETNTDEHKQIMSRIDKLITTLTDHDAWERSAKYERDDL